MVELECVNVHSIWFGACVDELVLVDKVLVGAVNSVSFPPRIGVV